LGYLVIKNQISEKGSRHKKLTKAQVFSNHQKSKTSCRVVHVFGFMNHWITWPLQMCSLTATRRFRRQGRWLSPWRWIEDDLPTWVYTHPTSKSFGLLYLE